MSLETNCSHFVMASRSRCYTKRLPAKSSSLSIRCPAVIQLTPAHLRENRVLRSIGVVPIQSTGLQVRLDSGSILWAPPSLFQIYHAHVVNREKTHSGPVLWAHVGNGGSIGDRELGNSRAKKLHKFPYNTNLAEVL